MKWNLKKGALTAGAVVTAPIWTPWYSAYAAAKNPKEFAEMLKKSYHKETGFENPKSAYNMAHFVGKSAVKDAIKYFK